MNKLHLLGIRGAMIARRKQEDSQSQDLSDVMRLAFVPKNEPKIIDGTYRHMPLSVPQEIEACSGISFFGRRVKSLVVSTDLGIICNCDADAVFAVYPFTCQPVITQALVNAAGRPVLTGVAGTTTSGARSATLAVQSEMQGALGVVLNAPTTAEDISEIAGSIDIPVVLTVVTFDDLVAAKISAGASVVNVAAGKNTPQIVAEVRNRFPDAPIIASSGKTGESIKETIAAGADAITWNPPTMQELQRVLSDTNRSAVENPPEPTAVA